jgi:hypothetical protein
MSYLSRVDSPPNWIGYGVKWFLFHLSIYVAVAAISGGLFFVGAAVYGYVSPAAIKPADDLLPRQAPLPLAPIVKPDGGAPAPVGGRL